ncbi:MAG: ferrous iron transporter B [Firmicutes bacterium]|nr:ferrous iron transporter B [Bacillota bacterium]
MLIGFPNVGKSLLFQHLTGRHAVVSNYPGTTVDFTRGQGRLGGQIVEIIDTPGIYSLHGSSRDKVITLELLEKEKPGLVLFVAEAAVLPRVMNLFEEIRCRSFSLILVLNMIDEAEQKGIRFHLPSLEKELGVPVVATSATRRTGLENLKKKMAKLLSSPEPAGKKKGQKSAGSRGVPAGWLSGALPVRTESRQEKLHLLLINPWIGYPLAFFILFFFFYFIMGILGAGTAVRLLEEKFFGEIFLPFCDYLAFKYISVDFFRELILGQFGLISMGLRYSLAIVLPLVTMYFLFFALLEDCGYLPRLAYLLHRPLRHLGLDGRGAIPLVLGFGCGTMGVLVTRLLETGRERFLATFLLSLGIPCSAQIGLIVGVLAPYPKVLFLWGFSWGCIFFLAGMFLNRILPGRKKYACIEFPPLRLPQCAAVLRKTAARAIWYIKEILPFFIVISLAFQLMYLGNYLQLLEQFLAPFLQHLGLPAQVAEVFLFGFLRRDYAAAGLYDLVRRGVLEPASLPVCALVLTLFFPCIAQLVITFRERGFKESLVILILIAFISYGAGYLLNGFISAVNF